MAWSTCNSCTSPYWSVSGGSLLCPECRPSGVNRTSEARPRSAKKLKLSRRSTHSKYPSTPISPKPCPGTCPNNDHTPTHHTQNITASDSGAAPPASKPTSLLTPNHDGQQIDQPKVTPSQTNSSELKASATNQPTSSSTDLDELGLSDECALDTDVPNDDSIKPSEIGVTPGNIEVIDLQADESAGDSDCSLGSFLMSDDDDEELEGNTDYLPEDGGFFCESTMIEDGKDLLDELDDDVVEQLSSQRDACLVCNQSLVKMEEREREIHVNACLDHQAQSQLQRQFTLCPICGVSLDEVSEEIRTEHVNDCTDKSTAKKEKPVTGSQVRDLHHTWVCPVCETFKSNACAESDDSAKLQRVVKSRLLHLKHCSISKGIDLSHFRALFNGASPIASQPPSSANSDSNHSTSIEAPPVVAAEMKDQPKENAFERMMSSAKRKPLASAMNRSNLMKGKKPKSMARVPSYKVVPGIRPFVFVDGFQFADASLTDVYVLTHFHSDHYGPLTGKRWDEVRGVIYCSEITARLCKLKLRVPSQYLRPLKLNTPTRMKDSRGKPIGGMLTLLEANHCPGAAMCLFTSLTTKKTTLHVGDFRWDYTLMQPLLHQALMDHGSAKIDFLYLDTTYCDPKYTLPSRAEAIDAAHSHTVALLSSMTVVHSPWDLTPKSRKRVLLLFGAYSIGKERLYMEVARRCGLDVCVDANRLKVLKCLDWPKDRLRQLTTDRSATPLWVVPLGHITFAKLTEYAQQQSSYTTIAGFRPTGWTYSPTTSASSSSSRKLVGVRRKKFNDGKKAKELIIFDVPYSEHSSFTELRDCVTTLKAGSIVLPPSTAIHRPKLMLSSGSCRVLTHDSDG